MDKNELEDLIKVVSWFARTEAELYLQKKWQNLLDDLLDVKKQQQRDWTMAELQGLDTDAT